MSPKYDLLKIYSLKLNYNNQHNLKSYVFVGFCLKLYEKHTFFLCINLIF